MSCAVTRRLRGHYAVHRAHGQTSARTEYKMLTWRVGVTGNRLSQTQRPHGAQRPWFRGRQNGRETPMRNSTRKPTSNPNKDQSFRKTILVPDASYINKRIPIREVAHQLNLHPEPKGKRCRCPLDRSHFASVWVKKNRIRCFKCWSGKRSPCWNPINLVMEVKSSPVGEAIKWIADRWKVPLCNMNLTLNKWGETKRVYRAYKPKPLPDVLKPSEGALTRARGWCYLTPSTRALALVILGKVSAAENIALETTQEKLRELTGIGSRVTMKAAMKQLRDIGLITTQRVAAPIQPSRNFTTRMALRLEWASNRFQDWLKGGFEYKLWLQLPYIRLIGIVQPSIDVHSLNVQNRANLHETEHPELTVETQAKEAANTFTDKDFTTTLFRLLDERGWL